MVTELARVGLGLPVAALLPLGLPWIRGRWWAAAAIAAAYAALVVLPVIGGWQGFLLVLAATALAAVLAVASRTLASNAPATVAVPSAPVGSAGARARDIGLLAALLIAAVALAALAALVAGADAFGDWLSAAVEDSAVSVVVSGGLAAVFVGGALVGLLLRPFTADLDHANSDLQTIAHAGAYIGWCERALFFSFIVAGEPEAAAVALAAKSFARFPSLTRQQEGFAEYFLIGTLTSLLVAMAAAVATRALLQHTPL